jgi:Bacterial Ig-like domain (group 3)
VVAGYYRVTASHARCTAAGGKQDALTRLLTIPPAALDLDLTLHCPRIVQTKSHTSAAVRRIGQDEYTLTARVRGRRPTGIVTFRAGGKLLGSAPLNPRTRSATLTVHDTKKPRLRAAYGGDSANAPSTAKVVG